jgi:hypothetical protein
MAGPGFPARATGRRLERRRATRRARVADPGSRGGDARRFFDDPEYLRIALAERTGAQSRREARVGLGPVFGPISGPSRGLSTESRRSGTLVGDDRAHR